VRRRLDWGPLRTRVAAQIRIEMDTERPARRLRRRPGRPIRDLMESIRLLGVVAFLVACLATGGRMLLLARRSREIPELALGVTLFASGGLGGVLLFLGTQRAELLGAAAMPVRQAGILCLNAGAVSLWLFTRRVFRPQSRWATALVAAAAVGIGLGLMVDLVVAGAADFAQRRWESPWSRLGFGLRLGAYAWGALESLRYFALMRRRQRLGLADPLVAHRFLLWGVAALAAVGIYAIAAANIATGTGDGLGAGVFDPRFALATALLGLTAASCLWLTFFTPGFYRRRLGARARRRYATPSTSK